MKMPEILVFARAFALGLIGAEIARIAFYAGSSLATILPGIAAPLSLSAFGLAVCAYYTWRREARTSIARFVDSRRIDLLLAVVIGACANPVAAPALEAFHEAVRAIPPRGTAVLLAALLLLLISPIVRASVSKQQEHKAQMHFFVDEDIKSREQDVYSNDEQAISFADSVLASSAHAGLVFGVDGPWGIGKTSFINLAERHWTEAGAGKILTFRFEPLRYASEVNLSERFLAELTASIQKQAFVPEFKPAASRYSRMLRGKADVSFLGFKLALEPSTETIDELLEDVDDVLSRIDKRLIIVIDDLDRLEAKAVNNVLFTVRRTFNLKRATYIICYDTEKLVGQQAEREHAREFLEKFITLKISLFVDSAAIKRFLMHEWSADQASHIMLPPERLLEVASLLTELSNLLSGKHAASYMSLLGDLRKVKRFVNSALLMQLGRTDLSRTDFSPADLVNLILLHLNYPGTFRRIYTEETEGRRGIFSARRLSNSGQPGFVNSPELSALLNDQHSPQSFLLRQLFCVEEIGIQADRTVDDGRLRSRACFNEPQARNLENYLKLIVRFVAPIPQETFALYRDAVDRVRQGITTVNELLRSPDFDLKAQAESTHDQFWRHMIAQSYDLTRSIAEDAITTLIDYLPHYSTDRYSEGLRQKSIYSLALLLNRTSQNDISRQKKTDHPISMKEVADRIFGERQHHEQGLIDTLASQDRGVIGWNDLMLFRLVCSADRGNQLRTLQSALLLQMNESKHTLADIYSRALHGMRPLSQAVFSLFKAQYIDPKINFLRAVDETPDEALLGTFRKVGSPTDEPPQTALKATRSSIKSFVTYQLSNTIRPGGSGVGCGIYDQSGEGDGGEIARLMNAYMFDVCFNPKIHAGNIYCFLDYCLANLSRDYFSDEFGHIPTGDGIHGGLDPHCMAAYWLAHRAEILDLDPTSDNREVVTANYVAYYRSDLPPVFKILDEMRKDADQPEFHDEALDQVHNDSSPIK